MKTTTKLRQLLQAAGRGFPDVGLLTMSELVTNARYIAVAMQIPVICDADTGYGNPLNVPRTVREYERQAWPPSISKIKSSRRPVAPLPGNR